MKSPPLYNKLLIDSKNMLIYDLNMFIYDLSSKMYTHIS